MCTQQGTCGTEIAQGASGSSVTFTVIMNTHENFNTSFSTVTYLFLTNLKAHEYCKGVITVMQAFAWRRSFALMNQVKESIYSEPWPRIDPATFYEGYQHAVNISVRSCKPEAVTLARFLYVAFKTLKTCFSISPWLTLMDGRPYSWRMHWCRCLLPGPAVQSGIHVILSGVLHKMYECMVTSHAILHSSAKSVLLSLMLWKGSGRG